jgi:hypothetical protein
MCFVNDDCDWYASICEKTAAPANEVTRCDECHRKIQPGETVHHIFMQQYEECHACDVAECECEERGKECCACDKPIFGETFDYDRCDECEKFLEAVQAAELEEGCSQYESQPDLGDMLSSIREVGASEAKRYYKAAMRLHPTLKPHLVKLWRGLFS